MRAVNIFVEPFEFINILDVRLSKGVNRHGEAVIRGVIAEGSEYEYKEMSLEDTDVKITALDLEDNECVLLHGILEDLQISTVNGLSVMELRVLSKSRILDLMPQITVYQNTEMTYDELVRATLAHFGGAESFISVGDGKRIGQMFVQYQETAWEFLVRMASMCNDVVVPNDVLPGIKLYFGFHRKPVKNELPLNPISYEVKRATGRYADKRQHSVSGFREADAVYYVVKDREIRQMGEAVEFLDRKLWITNIESEFDGFDLVHKYTLMNEIGTMTIPKRNHKIIGASLTGHVGNVQGINVKTILNHAHSNNMDNVKWHPFSSVYSSTDGTGLYAMANVGDEVRLHFPTDVEDAGYTISSVHTPRTMPSPPPEVSDENIPDMETANNQQIENQVKDCELPVIAYSPTQKVQFGPNHVFMQNGEMFVLFDDSEGLIIKSDARVLINAGGSVTISSGEGDIAVAGGESVNLVQGGAGVTLEGEEFVASGAKVLIE